MQNTLISIFLWWINDIPDVYLAFFFFLLRETRDIRTRDLYALNLSICFGNIVCLLKNMKLKMFTTVSRVVSKLRFSPL